MPDLNSGKVGRLHLMLQKDGSYSALTPTPWFSVGTCRFTKVIVNLNMPEAARECWQAM